MDFSTDNHRRNLTKKKDQLSLKTPLQNYTTDIAISKKNLLKNDLTADISEFGESQNFSLRFSESSVDDNRNELSRQNKIGKERSNKKTAEVIVISDSSDDDRADIIRPSKNEGANLNASSPGSDLSMTFSSIDISEIWTDEEKTSTVFRKKDIGASSMKNDGPKDSLLTSNDKNNMNHYTVSDKENNANHVNALTLKNRATSLKQVEDVRNSQIKQCHTGGGIIHKTTTTPNRLLDVHEGQGRLCSTPNSAKSAIRTTPLTMKDARDIARVIRSKQAVYNPPGQRRRKGDIVNSDSGESENSDTSEAMDDCKKKMRHPVWIKESDSESSDASPHCDQVPTKSIKTHVSRFLSPSVTDCDSAKLSERKKEEISRWLLSNPIDSRSNSSMSCVPLSEQNSLSSGNSSLERLELNFETPNNRDRIKCKTFIQDKKSKTVTTPAIQMPLVGQRQTTIDSFLRKVKNGDKENSYLTPTPITKTKKSVHATVSSEATDNIKIDDCADILDELYGDVWREKAGNLFPNSEPRRPHPKVQDRAVQTERKNKIISKKKGSSYQVLDGYSNNGDTNALINGSKCGLNLKKKSRDENKKWRNSFINDNVSCDSSDGETTYLTALTTLRVPNSRCREKKDTPMSASTKKAIEICDSDTEDDLTFPGKKIDDNKRNLSYSDDEIDLISSPGTSEFDPDDIIPPKSVIKKKTVSASKFTAKLAPSTRTRVSKSFLASLSPSIPLANAHPDAIKYRTNYKNTKDELCEYLYKLYNDKIFCNKLPADMLIEWNVRLRGTAGSCYNKTKKTAMGTVVRSSRIVLATKILDAPDRLRDTLVHEMCHAATWLINEVSDGHGPFWQAWASKAMKAFPELPSIKRCHDYKIATKYTYRCVRCGYCLGRHSKSLDVERKRCGHCFGKFELLINRTTKSGTVQVKTPTNKKATGFALFVKENYHLVRKKSRDMGHKEVMQILGQQFSAVKISKDNNNVDS